MSSCCALGCVCACVSVCVCAVSHLLVQLLLFRLAVVHILDAIPLLLLSQCLQGVTPMLISARDRSCRITLKRERGTGVGRGGGKGGSAHVCVFFFVLFVCDTENASVAEGP